MSAHDYHDALPGYSAQQVLHDGCGECEYRAKDPAHAIGTMDRHTFAQAWGRAAEWNRTGLKDLAKVEIPVLSILWAVQIKLEPRGFEIGELPSAFIASHWEAR